MMNEYGIEVLCTRRPSALLLFGLTKQACNSFLRRSRGVFVRAAQTPREDGERDLNTSTSHQDLSDQQIGLRRSEEWHWR